MSTIRLIVEVATDDPPRGWLGREGETPQPFAGLLELLAALDRLRGAAPREEPPDG